MRSWTTDLLAAKLSQRGAAMISADTLRRRAQDAARLVMAGMALDERDDCAAAILAQGLADLPTAPPQRRRKAPQRRRHFSAYRRACAAVSEADAGAPSLAWAAPDDPAQSFTAYRNRARHFRRDLLLRREREGADAELAQDRASADSRERSGAALTAGLAADDTPAPTTDEEARSAADYLVWKLAAAPHSVADGRGYVNVWTLVYVAARDADGAVCAHALDLPSVKALDTRVSRARTAIRRRHSDPLDLLDLIDGTDDGSGPARHRSGHAMAQEWRTAPDAPAPVTISKLRGGRRKARDLTDEDRAASMRRLARAQREMIRR